MNGFDTIKLRYQTFFVFISFCCPTCKEMSPEEIEYRYKYTCIDNDYILKAPAKYFPLSFEMMKILLVSKGLHINHTSFDATYNLKRMDGSYNLLAELLSDKNSIPLIFVKFLGSNKATISQRSDYGVQSILLGYQKLKDRLIAENICKTNKKRNDSDCVEPYMVLQADGHDVIWIPIDGNSKGGNLSVLGEHLW